MTSDKYDRPLEPGGEDLRPDDQPIEQDANAASNNPHDALVEFPAWLDAELEQLEEEYEGFATCISRRGYFGRG